MIREIAYALAGLVFVLYGIDFAIKLGDDAREPRRLRSKIPLFGHLLNMVQNGVSYYSETGKSTSDEIYTLGILHYKLYVCNSNRLMPFIQRSSRTLSFKPFIKTATRTHSNVTDETYHLYNTNGFLDDLSHVVQNSLAPGPRLDEQNMRTGNRVVVDVDALLDDTSGQPRQVMLLHWVRHAIVQASSCGVYGQNHPFLRPEVEEAYWKWQDYIGLHLVGLDIFGTGLAAREKVFEAHREYLRRGVPEDAAFVFTERVRVHRELGVSENDLVQLESAFPVAVFSNTCPTMFWTVWELFSRDGLLAEVRKEVEVQAVTGSAEKGFVLDVAAVKRKCPLLLSIFQETQRTRHIHANIREVVDDTLLDGKYFLKKGNYLQMPGNPVHMDEDIWGASASIFDPYRFVNKEGNSAVPGSAFLAWGAPPHLCPARQFASTEILIMLALLAMRTDFRPVKGGSWGSPALVKADIVTVLNPTEDFQVEAIAREQWRGNWSLKMSESTSRISLASG